MEKTQILLATTNQKKLQEIVRLVHELPYELLTLKDLPQYTEVEETGKTFLENAKLKALGYAAQSGLLTLGEDSGLCCDALDGAPGVFSARFSGAKATDDANNKKLLKLMMPLPDNCRQAHYESAIAIAVKGEILETFEGSVHGYISKKLKGNGGFGYDPLFYYPEFEKTFGEVPPEMKESVSHRSKALSLVLKFLVKYSQQESI